MKAVPLPAQGVRRPTRWLAILINAVLSAQNDFTPEEEEGSEAGEPVGLRVGATQDTACRLLLLIACDGAARAP